MARYVPEQVTSFEDLYRELLRVQSALDCLFDGSLEIVNAEPAKPKLGMIKQADGIGWNPGSGAGAYSYEGTSTASASWTKL